MRSLSETTGGENAARSQNYLNPSDALGKTWVALRAYEQDTQFGRKWRLECHDVDDNGDGEGGEPNVRVMTFALDYSAGNILAGMVPDDFPFVFQVREVKTRNGRTTYTIADPTIPTANGTATASAS